MKALAAVVMTLSLGLPGCSERGQLCLARLGQLQGGDDEC